MKIEIDADEAFRAVIEDLDTDSRYLWYRKGDKLVVDGLVDKMEKLLEAGTNGTEGRAQAVAEILKKDGGLCRALELYGIKIEVVE